MNFLFPKSIENPNSLTLGGKGAALAKLYHHGFDIPPWFGIPADTSWTDQELENALNQIGPGPFAVRSSGTMEDGSEYSFAGQFDSFLNVSNADVPANIKKVRDSATSDAIITYCREKKLPTPTIPTVLIQRMIAPKCAGVAFSADPVSGRRSSVVISAVKGVGDKLVSGDCDGETWRVDRNSNAQPENASTDTLTPDQARAIADLARRCEAYFCLPQDIEWAIDENDHLWLLQSRPITTLGSLPDPDDTLRVWDNSNIAESYGGVTTPLTFSFASRIYDAVYREFCVLMSVPAERIKKADDVFPQMLGLIRGRVYYNLANWYRVLALLPGFQVNRSFMEQMMGVREPLPDEIVQEIIRENKSSRFRDSLDLVGTIFGLIRSHFGITKQISKFTERLNQALDSPKTPLTQMSGEELVAYYRKLESQLLRKWDAPLVNDFLAMIFYGVLRGLCKKWANDEHGTLQNHLLMDCGDIISAEPPRRIMTMAKLAAKNPALTALLANSSVSSLAKLNAIKEMPELAQAFESYLQDFGDRCLEELKLESPTVRDDPASLLHSIGAMASRPVTEAASFKPTPKPDIGNPLKKAIFAYVLKHARNRVRARENLRFERTRLFGRVRTILREIGKRLHADGKLESAEDVFYLELGDILSIWEATGTNHDLAALARQRRNEFHVFSTTEAPPDRFSTRGPAYRTTRFEVAPVSTTQSEHSLNGTGACPGRVKGKARVVLDPRNAHIEPGEILVAQQTDPGWVVLFPAAAGLLVERGSLLSHSAIVSRELNLPCIVSLPGITTRLKTGDLIEMDGTSGVVTILES
jgi:phosphohistidine swiveling domain-containing protein